MFTENTLLAIRILYILKNGKYKDGDIPLEASLDILHRLCKAGIIKYENDEFPNRIKSYKLNYNLSEITMSKLLVAINEGIMIVPSEKEEKVIYNRCGINNHNLGVLNQMMRTMLNDIHIADNPMLK